MMKSPRILMAESGRMLPRFLRSRGFRSTAMHTACQAGVLVTCLLAAHAAANAAASGITHVDPGGGLSVFVGWPGEQRLEPVPEGFRGNVQVLVERSEDRAEWNMRETAGRKLPGENGRTTVVEFDGQWLPYCDSSVNRLVLTGPTRVPRDEMMRALAPGGMLEAAGGRVEEKPWPEMIDEWTHALHGPGNNAVAQDRVVGPPERLQWIGWPDYCRHHNFLASVSTLVSARGRLFSIIDEGSLLTTFLPPKWTLTARDAFNGTTLWKREIPDWGPRLRNFRSGPAELCRRLVAVGDDVFVTLGLEAPVSVLDAATGREKGTLSSSQGVEEILVSGGVVLMLAGSPKAELRDWAAENRDFTTGETHGRRLLAADAATRRLLWERRDTETATILPMSLAADNGRGFFVNERGVTAFDIATGERLWQAEEPVAMQRRARYAPTVVAHGNVLLYADRLTPEDAERFYGDRPQEYQARYRLLQAYPSRLCAYNAETGARLWDCPAGESFHSPSDVLVIDGVVWYTASPAKLEGDFETGRDLHTGEVVRTRKAPDINHGRCYRNKATSRYLLGGVNGVTFIDLLSDGGVHDVKGMRGTCQLGVLPCNGLLYLPPHACECDAERKLNGFFALAPAAGRVYPDPARNGPRLLPGPAAGHSLDTADESAGEDWPTFRHDLERSGRSSTELPAELKLLWRRSIGNRPTAPVCAGGRVYVAASEQHVLWALDAATGEPRWQYRTSGRIDSPPTIDSGLVVFGCRDGWLRCLRAEDGELVWRFRGAAEERQAVVRDQLESVWPLHGATLVLDGKVYFAAGRSSVLDGGVTVFCLDLASGKTLATRSFREDGAATQPDVEQRAALLDVLSFAGGRRIAMRSLTLTTDLQPAKPFAHLQSATGLLDDSLFHRSYWAYAEKISRWKTGTEAAAGNLLVIDGQTAYAFGRKPEFYIGHIKGLDYHLFAASLTPNKVKLRAQPTGPRSEGSFVRPISKYSDRGIATLWTAPIPLFVKGMTVAGEKLVAAGPPFDLYPSTFLVNPANDKILIASDPNGARGGKAAINQAQNDLDGARGAQLCLFSKQTGAREATIELPAIPVHDGLIAARQRLYLSTEDGVISCFGASPADPRDGGQTEGGNDSALAPCPPGESKAMTNIRSDVTGRNGRFTIEISGPPGEARQTVRGLKPGTQYLLIAGIRPGQTNKPLYIGVENHGAEKRQKETVMPLPTDFLRAQCGGGHWTLGALRFTIGPQSHSAVVFGGADASSPEKVYIDTVMVVPASPWHPRPEPVLFDLGQPLRDIETSQTGSAFYPFPPSSSAVARVEDDGTILNLKGNGWKALDFDYCYTPLTVLEFDFKGAGQDAVQGIGIGADGSVHRAAIFLARDVAQPPAKDRRRTTGCVWKPVRTDMDGWEHYHIPLDQYLRYLRDFVAQPYIAFINEGADDKPAECRFRNVRIFED